MGAVLVFQRANAPKVCAMTKPQRNKPASTIRLAQQHFGRAIMFREAAARLPGDSNGETFLPAYALLTHAIELALKAFIIHIEALRNLKADELGSHDLRGRYRIAVQFGLEDEPSVASGVEQMHDLHVDHHLRYPQTPGLAVPESIIVERTADNLILAVRGWISPRPDLAPGP